MDGICPRPRQVDVVFAAGWTEGDLHDAILTVRLCNLMNRLLDGHGDVLSGGAP
jgi:hypothetical protein